MRVTRERYLRGLRLRPAAVAATASARPAVSATYLPSASVAFSAQPKGGAAALWYRDRTCPPYRARGGTVAQFSYCRLSSSARSQVLDLPGAPNRRPSH